MENLNYFNCTLGEAELFNLKREFNDIPTLFKRQAAVIPEKPAVGFPTYHNGQNGDSEVSISYLSKYGDIDVTIVADAVKAFKQLHEIIRNTAAALDWVVPRQTKVAALLASSGKDFLLHWLGLIYLGYPVLLIAPEVTAAGMANLVAETGASILFHDEKHQEAAKRAADLATGSDRVQTHARSLLTLDSLQTDDNIRGPAINPNSTAYIHHTSGTSTGLPKPIPISHHGAVGVVPTMKDSGSTFTTTPLYHGGPADCLRAWTSGALIYLFPGIGDVPITGNNVLSAIEAIVRSSAASVSYFTSVPYVVESLMTTKQGIDMLKSMQLVGVGGAALSRDVGDVMAKHHRIRLISRYGSAECGFIKSSRRDYANDTDWNFLRSYDHPALTFERQTGPEDISELVLTNWPFMAKYNRGERVFATADCFKQHPNMTNRWLYHSRNDSQLTLSSGKKFDPAPLEASTIDSLRLVGTIREVYCFGTGRLFPGLLLIRSDVSEGLKDAEVMDQIWPIVQTVNNTQAPHAQIKRHMLVLLPKSTPKLARSSKGTLIRREIDEALKDTIRDAYQRQASTSSNKPLDLPAILQDVRQIVKAAVIGPAPGQIEDQQDLYKAGADSLACMEIRDNLQRNYGQVLDHELSATIAYDCGNIAGLTNYIYNLYIGAGMTTEDEVKRMTQMTEQYGRPGTSGSRRDAGQRNSVKVEHSSEGQHSKHVIVLTGATGTLGSHILHQLQQSEVVQEIHCLIRGASQQAASERLRKALFQKHLPSIDKGRPSVHVHCCKLSETPTLGLSQETYDYLCQNQTVTIHAAWSVNFNLPLKSFSDDLQSLQNLLNLAASSTKSPPFLFCSSTASVLGDKMQPKIKECISENPDEAASIGYARSKWVAEAVCARFQESCGLSIAIARIGQLCGDDKTGTWNVTEAWPLMLSSTSVTGALPDLKEKLNWLKVDIAASAVLEICFNKQAKFDDVPVYHVINSNNEPEWSQMLDWIKQYHRPDLAILEPAEWVQRLEKGEDHAAKKLLGLWKKAYCESEKQSSRAEPVFEMENTLAVAPVLKSVQPLDKEYFARVWAWVEAQM